MHSKQQTKRMTDSRPGQLSEEELARVGGGSGAWGYGFGAGEFTGALDFGGALDIRSGPLARNIALPPQF